MGFREWSLSLLGIIFVRTFLENFSGRSRDTVFSTDVQTIIHYAVSYFFIIFVVLLITHFFSKKDIISVSRVVLFGALIMCLPPLVDLVVTMGGSVKIAYLFTSSELLFSNFLTFLAIGLPGISIGIRIEFLVILALIFVYVHLYSRSIFRSCAAVASTYVAFFVFYAMPNFFAIDTTYEWISSVKNSLVGQNFFHPAITFVSVERYFEMYFNVVMSQIFYLSMIPLSFIFVSRWNPLKLRAILANSRFERVLHYFAMIAIGMAIAYYYGLITVTLDWFTATSIFILFFSFYAAWMYAIGKNDIVDLVSDKISNPNRPMVTGALTIEDMETSSLIFLVFALLGGYLVGHYALYMVVTFIALSYVYSVPPLQLKRFVIINSFIISLAALSAALAGFFTMSSNPHINALPLQWVVLIVVAYTLLANIKDIKDIKGDAAVGVYTVPVLCGLQRGKQIIAGMSVVALAMVPLISGISTLWYPFLPFAMASWYLLTRVNFKEKDLFTLYFMYLLVCSFCVVFL